MTIGLSLQPMINHCKFWRVPVVLGMALVCAVSLLQGAGGGLNYRGRVLYRANKAPVPGVLVELVEAEDDGRPTDEVLGQARADAAGRFTVTTDRPSRESRVALVVSAVRETAESGGDRRGEGYEIRSHRTTLGYLPDPSAAKPNTILIERRRIGRGEERDDD